MKSLPKGRLDAFADGVFAIVITLLVLDLPIPDASEDITALMPLWPDFLAYIISFAFIGSFWLAHSSITYLTKQETPRSYRFTLLMLFFVTLLPFTTKFMATYINGPHPTFPVIIYGLDLLAASAMMNTIIRSALSTPDILVDESAKGELNALKRRRQIAAVITGFAMILALFSPKSLLPGMLQRNYTIRFLPISLVMRMHSLNYIIFKSAFMVWAASLINQILSSLSTDGNSSGFGYQIKPVPMPVFQES